MTNMSDTTDLITLAELTVEGFGDGMFGGPNIDTLAEQLGDDVVLDDIGRRCCTRDTARRLFTERAEAHAREQEDWAKRAAEMAAESNARHARLRAIAAAQKKLLEANPGLSALAVMVGAETLATLDRKGRRLDGLFAGLSEGYSLSPPRPRPAKEA